MAAEPVITPERRLRHGRLPVPAERADLYWSCKQPELKGVTDGDLTVLIIETPEFQDVVMPKLEAIDRRNRTARGTSLGEPARWSALQLESVFLFRRVAGMETVKRAWEHLKGEPRTRLLLGLGEEMPSRPTLTRYISKHFDKTERAELYLELDRRLRQRVIQLPGFDAEARIIGMDGSQHGTHFTPPISRVNEKGKTTGEFVNASKAKGEPGAITAPDAGYVGGHHAKSGQGWQMLGLFTEHGTLLAWDISALHESEKPAAERVLATYESEVLPQRQDETISVCTADGGFNSYKIRQQLQDLRIVPNIHKASHKAVPGLPDDVAENAAKLNKTIRPFKHPRKPHYSNWLANGHGEIECLCGHGSTKRLFEITKGKKLSIGVKGQCSTCGNVRILAGKWQLNKKTGENVRCYQGDTPDPTIGNPLTFNDKLSAAYGQDRFGWGESVHATLRRRFGLLKDKSWMRDITEVRTEFAIAASAISVLLLERHARQSRPATISSPASSPQAGNNQPGAALPLAA
jgi:hypothetical protein